MSKHTPGPWYALPGLHNFSVRYKTGDKNLPMVNIANVRGHYGDGFPFGSSEANLRLILAAPDLLEACKLVIAYDKNDATDGVAMMVAYNNAVKAARDAIAKATGSAS